MESDWTPPTPPICCPDVVPPSAPLVQAALGDDLKVKLRWIRSREPDVASYRIYRASDELSAADVRSMEERELVAPTPTSVTPAGARQPSAVPDAQGNDRPGWLEFAAEAAPAGEWLFRIVAEDDAGNRSEPSRVLRGRSIKPPPAPPVWNQPVREPAGTPTHVTLSWTHPDSRLAVLVERRPGGGALWSSPSGWLPRGVHTFADSPPDLALAWEYRLRVRDANGQAAGSMPVVSLPFLP